jgi:pimeloyl-ACP methyl ester carboxylesterase
MLIARTTEGDMTQHGRPWGAVALGAVALLAGACGSDDDGADGGTTTAAAEASTTVGDPDRIDDMFDIGGGRSLHLVCEGEGTPTFLLEAGDASDASEWRAVQPRLSAATRTCAYDRLGVGRSSAATGCRGVDAIVSDLEALLDAAGVEGPFIFVGASGGGYLAVEMAARHPDETAGVATLDTARAITDAPPEILEEISCDAPGNVERRDYYAVEHDVWDDKVQIGDFPMKVFTNDPGPDAEEGEATNVVDQQGWFVLTPKAEQVVVTSGHDIAENEVDLVVTELLELLEAARSG